jgi:hypothetical protein
VTDHGLAANAPVPPGPRVPANGRPWAASAHDVPHPIGDPDDDEGGLVDEDEDDEEDDDEDEEPMQVGPGFRTAARIPFSGTITTLRRSASISRRLPAASSAVQGNRIIGF